jgi:NADH-quinone oxidoreductase subunit A
MTRRMRRRGPLHRPVVVSLALAAVQVLSGCTQVTVPILLPETSPLWPLVLYFGLVLFVVVAMLGLSFVLGERHSGRATDQPYEAGMLPTGPARLRFDVRFYLIAIFFVIFDLEAAFLFAWAVAARELGWSGYVEAVIFTVILVAGLVYLWRTGALEMRTFRQHNTGVGQSMTSDSAQRGGRSD